MYRTRQARKTLLADMINIQEPARFKILLKFPDLETEHCCNIQN